MRLAEIQLNLDLIFSCVPDKNYERNGPWLVLDPELNWTMVYFFNYFICSFICIEVDECEGGPRHFRYFYICIYYLSCTVKNGIVEVTLYNYLEFILLTFYSKTIWQLNWYIIASWESIYWRINLIYQIWECHERW